MGSIARECLPPKKKVKLTEVFIYVFILVIYPDMTGNLIIHAVNCRQVVGTLKVINCVPRLHLKEIGLYYINYVFLFLVENKNTTIR